MPTATQRVLSLAPLTVLELGPDELVSCAAAAGFDAVGLRLIRVTAEEPQRPTTEAELMRQGRTDRLFPGTGRIDLVSMLHALPPQVPRERGGAGGVAAPAIERARAAARAARRVLAVADGADRLRPARRA